MVLKLSSNAFYSQCTPYCKSSICCTGTRVSQTDFRQAVLLRFGMDDHYPVVLPIYAYGLLFTGFSLETPSSWHSYWYSGASFHPCIFSSGIRRLRISTGCHSVDVRARKLVKNKRTNTRRWHMTLRETLRMIGSNACRTSIPAKVPLS